MFVLSEATIRRYIHQFNEAGLPGLTLGQNPGQLQELTWTQEEWLDLLA